MPANNNVPLGLVPWRLHAASPGTLDIRVDVEAPVEWQTGGEASASVLDPMTGQYALLSGYGVAASNRKGSFTLFIPDSPDTDDVVEALIDARLDPTVPYYTWSALDGTESWKVRFNPADKMTIGYTLGHRVVKVGLIQIASNTATVATTPPHLEVASPPFVTGTPTIVVPNDVIGVVWGRIVVPSPSDYIAVFGSASSLDPSNRYGSVSTGQLANGTANLTVSNSTPAGIYHLRMYLSVGPSLINGPDIVVS